jgi:shikimate dehydrogenase
MTDLYAVIGNPVAHSKSPFIHSEFARQTGEPVSYGLLYAEISDFESAMQRFREQGGRGLNVTVPFKHRAYAAAQRRSERAEQARAVNTLTFAGGDIAGDNTDGIGLVRDLTLNLGCVLRGRRVLLMGAGGASYGVCGPILDEQPAALVVANRTLDKAIELSKHFGRLFPGARALSAARYEDLDGRLFDLVINGTSAGLSNAMPALPPGVFGPDSLAYEMVYGKATPFMAFAASEGARTADGLGMLVEQAAESFYIWRGVRPQTASVIAQLRAMTSGMRDEG